MNASCASLIDCFVGASRLLAMTVVLIPSFSFAEALHGDLGSIKFHADYYERDDLKKEIVARGNVSLSMGDDYISAKEVRINTETKDIIAEGPVVFQTTGFQATAERMTYNFSTRLGVLEKAEVISEAEPGQATTQVTFQPKTG
ncbi:MAG TPA: LptA/OstA family protein, partial [Bdellovibrionota bacterium]|nr:LptA/OstA family protein [Bdellovibrionota bacterium]